MNEHCLRLKKYAIKRGASVEDAEDFSSYCKILFLEGRRSPLTKYKWLFADFRKSTKRVRYDVLAEVSTTTSIVTIPEGISTQERSALILYCSWGFTEAEIGHVLGVSESRISRLFKGLRKRFSDPDKPLDQPVVSPCPL